MLKHISCQKRLLGSGSYVFVSYPYEMQSVESLRCDVDVDVFSCV